MTVSSVASTLLSSAAGASTTSKSSTTTTSSAGEVKLNRLLQQYRVDLSKGETVSELKSLANQIMAEAKALGQSVSLPVSPTQTTSSGNSVDVTA